MKEDLLHYIWKTKAYRSLDIVTTLDQRLTILNPGTANRNAGPDFLNARIMIDDTLWAGSVEIHVKSSDWKLHKHDGDPLYQNVILHVVYHHDTDIAIDGSDLPVLELNGKVPPRLFERYERMMYQMNAIKCSYDVSQVPLITWMQIKERKIVERLEDKRNRIESILSEQNGDWEQSSLILLARYFGGTVNSADFEELFRSIPIALIRKYKHDKVKLEALIFGRAGMLSKKYTEGYPKVLLKEYHHLKRLHNLEDIVHFNWKFSRMRPMGFPTIRLAQLTAVIHQEFPIMNKLINSERTEDIFRTTILSDYWLTHYRFGSETKQKKKRIGASFTNHLTINAIVPLVYTYGFYYDNMTMVYNALDLLKKIPPENNRIVRLWQSAGLKVKNAEDTQALLQLYDHDCSELKCLDCPVGHNILKKETLSIVEEPFENIA